MVQLKRLSWGAVFLLALIGVGAAIGRAVYTSDLAERVEPVRARLLAVGIIRHDPHAAQRALEVSRFDRRFADHPVIAVVHVVPGALFLVLAPLQFSSNVRRRFIRLHRWSGRLLIVAGFACAVSGLYFGVLVPYAGWSEAAPILVFGGLFLIALARAFVAIRRGETTTHREWMLRAFAVAIGISTVRIVSAVFDVALTPVGFTVPQIFVLSVWTGWLLTVSAAELWIRRTRARTAAARPAEVEAVARRNITLSIVVWMLAMSAFACAPADRVIKPPEGSYVATRATVVINGVQEATDIARVKPECFKVEGLRPFLGRFFIGEEYTSARIPVAVLSHRYWTERLRAEPSVIGSQLQIDGQSAVVIGVAPPSFRHDAAGALWIPGQPQ